MSLQNSFKFENRKFCVNFVTGGGHGENATKFYAIFATMAKMQPNFIKFDNKQFCAIFATKFDN